MPGLSAFRGGMMAEAAAVCLHQANHNSGCAISIIGDNPRTDVLEWQAAGPQQFATYADLQEATEHGAYGLAILEAIASTGMIVLERSPKGPGFDYWLGHDDGDDDALPFQNAVRLEVSGILAGDDAQIRARARVKIAQVAPSNDLGPARITIVEFSAPRIRVEAV